jgi:hypothetical protein
MVATKITGVAAVTVMALTQLCPAPIPVIVLAAGAWASAGSAIGGGAAAVASGAVAGGVSSAINNKRDLANGAKFVLARRAEYPPGVNQQDYDRCVNEVNAQEALVTFSDSEHGMITSLKAFSSHCCENVTDTVSRFPGRELATDLHVSWTDLPLDNCHKCMLIDISRNLASGLTGDNGGSYPVPMSTSSIEYWNVSDDERNALAEAIAGNIAGSG